MQHIGKYREGGYSLYHNHGTAWKLSVVRATHSSRMFYAAYFLSCFASIKVNMNFFCSWETRYVYKALLLSVQTGGATTKGNKFTFHFFPWSDQNLNKSVRYDDSLANTTNLYATPGNILIRKTKTDWLKNTSVSIELG